MLTLNEEPGASDGVSFVADYGVEDVRVTVALHSPSHSALQYVERS